MENNTQEVLVHVICQTHDDPGWIWTLDDYFQGTDDCKVSVKRILDNMLVSLTNNKERKFSYVEMSFFQPWYEALPPAKKDLVKSLFKEKRLEFVNGGYVIHDEASTHYHNLLDQMRLGLAFLKDEFNYTPRVGWFVDPFGHSSSSAHLMAQLGFEYLVLTRIHYQEKLHRKGNQNMEFIYNPYGTDKQIYTHISYDHYCPSPSLRLYPKDKKITLTQEEKVKVCDTFYQEMCDQRKAYRHNNILLYYGDDFAFDEVDINYENIEQIMTYVNENYKGKMKMIFSTPSQYFDYVAKAKPNVETVTDQDFFPYAENPHSYWTGYFSTRANLKGLIKQLGILVSASSKLLVEYYINNYKSTHKEIIHEAFKKLTYARERLGILQHHDAITGTSKEKTNKDYENMALRGIDQMKMIIAMLYKSLSDGNCINCLIGEDTLKQFKTEEKQYYDILNWPGLENDCHLFNIRIDNKNEEKNSSEYFITTNEGKMLNSNSIQFFDTVNGFKYSSLQFIMHLQKKSLFTGISITKNQKEIKKIYFNSNLDNKEIEISKTLLFNPSTRTFKKKNNLNTIAFRINHSYYNSYDGSNSSLRPQNSNPDGAYIFSPCEDSPIQSEIDLSRSFYQQTPEFASIVFRYKYSYLILVISFLLDEIHSESIWDPVINKQIGFNHLLQINSDIDNIHKEHNQPVFYTDSQGINMIQRIKDIHLNYPYTKTESVSSNYYPLASAISICNDTHCDFLNVFTDRGESASSMLKGEIELIVQRNSVKDDWKGAGERLYENSSMNRFFPVKHLITFNSIDRSFYYTNSPVFIQTLGMTKDIIAKCLDIIINNKHSDFDILFEIKNENDILIQVGNCYNNYFKQGTKEAKFNIKSDYGIIKECFLNGVEEINQNSNNEYILNPLEFKAFLMKLHY